MKDINLDNLSDSELWDLYSLIPLKLKERGAIRSGNITGDRGEWLAIEFYNATKGLPKLQLAPPSTQNVDAISIKGERYSIKTITYPGKTTGVFHGYGSPQKPIHNKMFEYLIIVQLESYQPKMILEVKWEDFYELKRWHLTMQAFNISLNKEVVSKSKVIYIKH